MVIGRKSVKYFYSAAGLAVVVGLFGTEGALWAENYFALPDGSAETIVMWAVAVSATAMITTGLRKK